MVKSIQSSGTEKSAQLAKTRRQIVRDKVVSAAKTVKSGISRAGRAVKKTIDKASTKNLNPIEKDKLMDNLSETGTAKTVKSKSRIKRIGSGISSSARSVKGVISRAGAATKKKAVAAAGAVKGKAVAAAGAVKGKAVAAAGAVKSGVKKVGGAVKGGIKKTVSRNSVNNSQKTPKVKSNSNNILFKLRDMLRPKKNKSIKNNNHEMMHHNHINPMDNKIMYSDAQNSINSDQIYVQGTKQSISQKKSI